MERGFDNIPIDKYIRNVGIPIIKTKTGIDRDNHMYQEDKEQTHNLPLHSRKEANRPDRLMCGIYSRMIFLMKSNSSKDANSKYCNEEYRNYNEERITILKLQFHSN